MKGKFDFTNLFAIIPGGLLIFMYVSAFAHLNNIYSNVCAEAGWGWKILGIVLSVAGFGSIIKSDGERGLIILGGFLIAMSLCSFMGFNF